MRTFSDLYEAYLHWRAEGGYLTGILGGTLVITDQPPPNASQDGNSFGIYPGVFDPPLSREDFHQAYSCWCPSSLTTHATPIPATPKIGTPER